MFFVFGLRWSRQYGFPKETSPELGHAAPCRSYRSLICFSEFKDFSATIEKAMSRDDIAAVNLAMKAFKAAYADLLSMCKASVNRLKTTLESMTKKADQEKVAAGAAKRGRPKKTVAEAALALT
jgi:hypothetical protein